MTWLTVRRSSPQTNHSWLPGFEDFVDDFMKDFDLASQTQNYSPRLDVIEDTQNIKITAEVPGVDEKDLEISFTGDSVVIRGEKKKEEEEKDKNYYRMERTYGSFQREIPLRQDMVDAAQAEASFKKGVLTITIPKKKEAVDQVKKIPIRSE